MLYIMGNYVNKQQVDRYCDLQSWKKLVHEFSLTAQQAEQLQQYGDWLIEWNEKFNLTAILDPNKIVQYHFYDSLALSHYMDFSLLLATADIGTGAGFPGIPLKILFPHLVMVLIEVNNKKRAFLEYVIQELGLENVIIYPYDWRTFLRSTNYQIDCFFARASLQPEELVRIFKPSSAYQDAELVYWASQQWVAGRHEASFKDKEIEYEVADDVTRKYVVFKNKKY
jgi:16S rRNA (guanine(527)-N(7))-methyltransferase RsmG